MVLHRLPTQCPGDSSTRQLCISERTVRRYVGTFRPKLLKSNQEPTACNHGPPQYKLLGDFVLLRMITDYPLHLRLRLLTLLSIRPSHHRDNFFPGFFISDQNSASSSLASFPVSLAAQSPLPSFFLHRGK